MLIGRPFTYPIDLILLVFSDSSFGWNDARDGAGHDSIEAGWEDVHAARFTRAWSAPDNRLGRYACNATNFLQVTSDMFAPTLAFPPQPDRCSIMKLDASFP